MIDVTIAIAIIGGLTALISLISEVMACSKCKYNGIIDGIRRLIKNKKSKKEIEIIKMKKRSKSF